MKISKKFIFLLLLLNSGLIFAQKTTTHKVVSGESIYSIAKKYGITEADIYQYNPKTKGVILQLNTELKIPIIKVKKNSKSKTDFHIVEEGESMYSIAKKYGLAINELKKYNPEVSPKSLQIGQKINLKPTKVKKEKTVEEPKNSILESGIEDAVIHIVRKGESMSAIARQYNIKLIDLLALNQELGTNLQIGDKVVIKKQYIFVEEVKNGEIITTSESLDTNSDEDIEEPDDSGNIYHVVEKGETLNKISKKYNISVNQIKEINPKLSNKLAIGRKILIVKGVNETPNIVESDEDAEELPPLSAIAVEKVDFLITKTSDQIGTRYRSGGTSEGGFDCSGLMCFAFHQLEIKIPRTSAAQSNYGKKVKRKNAQKGDLIFFSTNGRGTINHVGMITEVDGDEIFFIHSSVSRGVIISSVNEAYYAKRFKKIMRVLE